MTYRPAADERSVVPARTGVSKERIYLKDLSRYLHHNPAVVRKFAWKWDLVRLVYCGQGPRPAEYVSPYGAQRIIAYIRAIQGDAYLHGRNFHEWAEKHAGKQRSWRLGAAAPKSLAIPVAGTEDEHQR